MLMAVRTSGFDVSKTVSVYTDSVKTKLIGTADFRDSGYSFVGFTPEGGYIDTYALYFEFPDSYGDDVGLSGCDVYQEAWDWSFGQNIFTPLDIDKSQLCCCVCGGPHIIVALGNQYRTDGNCSYFQTIKDER